MTREINFLLSVNTIGQILGAPSPLLAQEGPVASPFCQSLHPTEGPGGHFILPACAIQAGLAPREKQPPIIHYLTFSFKHQAL